MRDPSLSSRENNLKIYVIRKTLCRALSMRVASIDTAKSFVILAIDKVYRGRGLEMLVKFLFSFHFAKMHH